MGAVVEVVAEEQGFDWAAEETMTVAGMAYRMPWERQFKVPRWDLRDDFDISNQTTITLTETGFKCQLLVSLISRGDSTKTLEEKDPNYRFLQFSH